MTQCGRAVSRVTEGPVPVELIEAMEGEGAIEALDIDRLPDGCLDEFSGTLQEIRKTLGMTQFQMASRLSVSKRQYRRMESGDSFIGTRAKNIDVLLEAKVEELLTKHPRLKYIRQIPLSPDLRDEFRRMEEEGKFVNAELRKITYWSPDMSLKKAREVLGYLHTRALNWRYWQYQVYRQILTEVND